MRPTTLGKTKSNGKLRGLPFACKFVAQFGGQQYSDRGLATSALTRTQFSGVLKCSTPWRRPENLKMISADMAALLDHPNGSSQDFRWRHWWAFNGIFLKLFSCLAVGIRVINRDDDSAFEVQRIVTSFRRRNHGNEH